MSPRPPRRTLLRRRSTPWLISAVLLMATAVLVFLLQVNVAERADRVGVERAGQVGAILGGELRHTGETVAAVRVLAGADPGSLRRGLRRYGDLVARDGSLLALAYAPRVPGAARRTFEERQQVVISDLSADRGHPLERAARRGIHFPAMAIVPGAQERLLRGLDAYGVAPLAVAIDRTIATGRPQTASLTGLGAPEPAFAVTEAVYREGPSPSATASERQQLVRGVVIGVYPVATLERAIGASLGPDTAYRLYLGAEPVSIRGTIVTPSSSAFAAGGRRWRVEVARPTLDETPVLVAAFSGVGIVLLVSALIFQLGQVERERAGVARAAEQARAERDRTAAVVSSLQEGLVLVGADGRLTGANDRFCQMTGADREGLSDRELTDFLAAPTPAAKALVREQLAAGAPGDHDHSFAGPDGAPVPVILSVAPLVGPAGEREGAVCTVKDISERKRAEDDLRASEGAYRSLAAEQGAFRRVATAIAEERDTEALYRLAAEEAARMLGAAAGWVARLERGAFRVLGTWGAAGAPPMGRELGVRIPIEPESTIAELARTGHVTRNRRPAGLEGESAAFLHSVIAPIRVSGQLWGGLAVARDDAVFPPEADDRLVRIAELVATAVQNAESRALLAAQALRDPLTELANHRSFWEHLRRCADRAGRDRSPLSLVVMDIDHFKQVNDLHGHQAGDRALAELARRLSPLVRDGELVARTGGEEFCWILPDTDRQGARAAAERARREVAAAPIPGVGRITISAGVCELAQAESVSELYALADGALYWAKTNGRDQCVVYDPAVVVALSAEERRRKAEQDKVMVGLRGLARAVDARDPMTQEHSERVAALSERLARELGWPAEQAGRLHDAALIHDVGKVGIPDAILLKAGPLTSAERSKVSEHVGLSVSIAAEVLDEQQSAWVGAHHERFDGSGYPAGLAGEQIPLGGRIMAVADAWDVMVTRRPYKEPRPPADALRECRALAGAQFDPHVVEALADLIGRGELSEA